MATYKIVLEEDSIKTEKFAITGTSTSRAPVYDDQGNQTNKLTLLDVSTKVKGSDLDERATTDHVLKDADGVINMGGGDDIFVFSSATNGHKTPGQLSTVNAIVDMGTGNDTVFLTHGIEDYVYTLRSDGGIKMQLANGGDGDPAVTFQNAEKFSFLVGNERHEYSHDALEHIINAQIAHDGVLIG